MLRSRPGLVDLRVHRSRSVPTRCVSRATENPERVSRVRREHPALVRVFEEAELLPIRIATLVVGGNPRVGDRQEAGVIECAHVPELAYPNGVKFGGQRSAVDHLLGGPGVDPVPRLPSPCRHRSLA